MPLKNMSHQELTRELLIELLHYDSATGVFSRRVSYGKCVAGQPAGDVNSCGYLIIWVAGRRYLAHRLAWFYVHGRWPEQELDHVNMVRADNRIANLREASRFENMRNRKARPQTRSGFKGVTWSKSQKRWRAKCSVDGRQVQIGEYRSAEEAASAYREFASRVHGEFFRGQ